MEKTMDKIVQVAKARGFVYPRMWLEQLWIIFLKFM